MSRPYVVLRRESFMVEALAEEAGGEPVYEATEQQAWVDVGVFDANDDEDAIRQAVAADLLGGTNGSTPEYAAVPGRNWHQLTPRISNVPVITFGKAPAAA